MDRSQKLKTMHFIWAGALISDEKMQNILHWTDHCTRKSGDRAFASILWTDRVRESQAVLKKFQSSKLEGSVQINDVSQLDGFLTDIEGCDPSPPFVQVFQHAGKEQWQSLRAYALDNRNAEYQGRNYGISSDIYRLAALYILGGAYMDCDNTPRPEISRLGTEGNWSMPGGELLWDENFGNSYLVAEEGSSPAVGALAAMAQYCHALKSRMFNVKQLIDTKLQQLEREKASTEKLLETKALQKGDGILKEISELAGAWKQLDDRYQQQQLTDVSAYDLQRDFPSVAPGDLQKNPDKSSEDQPYWNPRYKLTTETTGPLFFQAFQSFYPANVKPAKVLELTGWVVVGRDHAWMK